MPDSLQMYCSDSVKSIGLRTVIAAAFSIFLAACASPAQRTDREAIAAGLSRSIVQGTSFRHLIYAREVASSETQLTVFIEGDGIPWEGGRIPASDPTTRNPLALRMMLASRGPAIYVARPCYNDVVDRACAAQPWTFARYSSATVDSMAKAIDDYARATGANDLKIVGYSGGGVLAVLIAERLANVSAVVTIAANLDVAAWTAQHRYLPLGESLDPSRSARLHGWKEIHLQGTRDETVPVATTRAYFERYPQAQALAFEDYDHVCCWLVNWSAIEQRIDAQLR